jgi:DNA-binding NtrC family response regulator
LDKKRILVIDDDDTVRQSIARVLELDGYEVATAETGAEAVSKAKSSLFNLALIDIRLPDMEGTQLLTALPETVPKMVKIIVTGFPSLSNAIEAVNKGADAYVTKPIVNINDFLTQIREYLKRQEESEHFTEQKVREFVETRLRQHQPQD